MTLLGYLSVFGYIFLLIFALGPLVLRHSNVETSRKAIHTLLFAVWCLIDLFFRGTIHQIIIPVCFILLNTLSYFFGIYRSVEREERNHPGTVYFALAVTAVMSLSYYVPSFYYPAGIAVFCLTFGDGFAALVGYNYPTKKIRGEKSLGGFLACFLASFLSLLLFVGLYPVSLPLLSVMTIALLSAVLELTGGGLDNFTIVSGTLLLSWGMLQEPGGPVTLCALAGLGIFLVVFFSGAIRYYGALLSLFMVFAFAYWGGGFGLGFLLGTYFTIFFLSVLKHRLLHRAKKESARGFLQILINGGLGTLFILLYGLTGRPGALYTSLVAIGGCFVDSLSSDLGVLSRRSPYDPFRGRRVAPGLSGGMSLLGTGAAALGGAGIALALGLVKKPGLPVCLIVGGLIFLQTLLDSLLGSLIQVKLRCPVCGEITEQREHCGAATLPAEGWPWVDNNMVNLLSSLCITLAAALLLWAE